MSKEKWNESFLKLLLCDDEEATKRYVEGFADRVAAREKKFAEQAKAQQWTKANDDFEYNI